ncbi:MAG: TMCO1/EMC3 family protein [Desulfobacteraceae bacterium]|nr:TMCO1/EMC3 family protein [Desulfobacteraceae bacterium]
MNNLLDKIWEPIEAFLNYTIVSLDRILSPLEVFGPWFVIFILAFAIVILTRIIARFYVTKRYLKLEKEFKHWHGVREEAMKQSDRKKGKALAKNIDQAELNKAYYDYFFEGLLKHFATNVLPILLMVAYVTKVYTPQTLLSRFGEKWIFSFSLGSTSPTNVSSLLWFIICLIFSFILYAVLKMIFKKKICQKKPCLS